MGEGPSSHPQITKHSIEFPAVAAGTQDRVLLRGTMYQLGSKHVKLGLTQLKMIVAETVTCSLPAHSEDFQPDAWKNLVQAPAKVILNRLGELQPLITSVWGRSFRKDKDRSVPADSTTVQVWVSLPTSATNDLLRLSGFSSVYVTPVSVFTHCCFNLTTYATWAQATASTHA